MNRITKKDIDGAYTADIESRESIVRRLGQFEDAYEELMSRRMQIPKDLEEMRTNGKEKTVRYKETMSEKLINNSIAAFFERHGFK